MNIPRVKVCGLCRAEDAVAAVQAGAEALGVVHYPPSPRSVSAETAAQIFAGLNCGLDGAQNAGQELPATALKVAVMVNPEPSIAEQWATTATANAVQLCGEETAEEWRGFPLPILRRIGVDATAVDEMRKWADVASLFVLDHPASAGGSGKTVDFELAAQLCRLAPCLLAGGLADDNVADAIAAVQPSGVDASSRLEQSTGQKDQARTKLFVQRALSALSSAPAH